MDQQTELQASYLDGLWKFFASIRLTVVVLFSLATLSIIGTLIPQNQSPDQYFNAFGPVLFQVLSTLDIFDMYHSWWFQLLLITMVINIVICSIDRLRYTGKIIFVRQPVFNLNGFRRRPSRRELKVSAKTNDLKSRFEKLMAQRFRYCNVVPVKNGYAITAEKGRWTRLGVYGVHLSVVIMLVGALVGTRFGFEGYVNIPEGETVQNIQLRSNGMDYPLPFSVRCEDFDVQFYDTGAPKEFRSTLLIIENGETVRQKDIIVNDPLRYKGINFFQSSYGKLDEPAPLAELPETFPLQFNSLTSGMTYSFKTGLNKPIDLPEGLGSFVVTEYQPNAQFRSMALGPTIIGTLSSPTGESQTIQLPLRFPQFDGMRRGKMVISIGKGLLESQERYYTGLQVTKDPGVGTVYLGFTLMILGCWVTFFMSHQQVVVEVQPNDKGSVILVAGTTNKNKVGFQNRMQQLTDKLEKIAAGG